MFHKWGITHLNFGYGLTKAANDRAAFELCFDDAKAISDDVFRDRGTSEVSWAVNPYKGNAQSQLAGGHFQAVILMGVTFHQVKSSLSQRSSRV